jgi:D-alanyl-D-alanine carboxypeptidase (penicillin-binding protein 5/6)
MMFSMKKLLAAFAAFLVCCSTAFAQAIPAPTIAARSWLLLDATSGEVLASQDPDMRIEPASLTKIMTAYLVFAAMRDKRLDREQMVNVSVDAWKVDSSSSKMFIDPSKPVKAIDLLYGLMIQSGNDAAVALAEAVAGSQNAFVELMNREAQRMGLKSTHFANPHGLPDPQNYSTARDLSVLAANMVKDFPESSKIDSMKQFTFNRITQPNRNRLLWLDSTVDGMKTGHTESSGFSLIATARRPIPTGERRLIAVVLGTNSDQMRTQEGQKLLNWGFQNFDTVKLYAKGQPVATPAVWKGSQNQVPIGFTHDVYVTVPKGSADKLKSTLDHKDPLIAPIMANAQIGTLKVLVEDKVIDEVPAVALQDVNQATVFGRAWDSLRLMLK